MYRFLKIIFFIGLFISLLWMTFLVLSHMVFSGVLDKKYTREEWDENFRKHEKDFSDLVTFFRNRIPKETTYTVSFCTSNVGKVSIVLMDPAHKRIAARNLEIGSAQLDPILLTLGWPQETVKDLADPLIKINCNCIRTTEMYGKPIEIYPYQNGWGSYNYRVFELPLPDSLIPILGEPLSRSDFGKRIILQYTTAL